MLPGMIMCQAYSGISVKWPTATLKFGLHIMVLSGSTDLRIATVGLPEHTAQACWRLLDLLESISDGRQQ